jgi:hypothetical protein
MVLESADQALEQSSVLEGLNRSNSRDKQTLSDATQEEMPSAGCVEDYEQFVSVMHLQTHMQKRCGATTRW